MATSSKLKLTARASAQNAMELEAVTLTLSVNAGLAMGKEQS